MYREGLVKYSNIALKILAAKEYGLIKTNAQFWTQFSEQEKIEEVVFQNHEIDQKLSLLEQEFISSDNDEGVVSIFDTEFPIINKNVKNSDKPFLLFYKGDITLLHNLNKNVAVIGLLNPTKEIEKREIEVVKQLVNNGLVIVSGLAKGCDTIAHKVCVDAGNKTIAILPTQLNKISPAVNRTLAKKIVDEGGLLLTEYYKEATSKYEATGRYIERDRLQAMFAKAIVLIASYRKGEGDSGSRHAMESARIYGIERYAMFNEEKDIGDKQFGLNKDFIKSKNDCVEIMQPRSIEYIKNIYNLNLEKKNNYVKPSQLTLF